MGEGREESRRRKWRAKRKCPERKEDGGLHSQRLFECLCNCFCARQHPLERRQVGEAGVLLDVEYAPQTLEQKWRREREWERPKFGPASRLPTSPGTQELLKGMLACREEKRERVWHQPACSRSSSPLLCPPPTQTKGRNDTTNTLSPCRQIISRVSFIQVSFLLVGLLRSLFACFTRRRRRHQSHLQRPLLLLGKGTGQQALTYTYTHARIPRRHAPPPHLILFP